MTRTLIAVFLSLGLLGFIGPVALAQNSLRPDELPQSDAKPIQPAKSRKAGKTSSGGPFESSKEARLLLHEALQISQSGKTIPDLTGIIELCKQATAKPLTAEEAKYARDLLAWSYNKRGEAYAEQAVEFMGQGSEKEAAKLDRQALDDFKAAVKNDPLRWKAIHNRGVSYGVLGLHEDAVADFTRVLELKDDYVNAWFNRAEIHAENGRLAEAIQDYSEAIRLKPEDGGIRRQRGRAYTRSNKHQEALADFDFAVQLDRNDVVSLVERADCACRLADWGIAANDYRTALEIDPDSATGYRGAAWLMATCPQVKYRNSKSAIEAAQQAIELANAQGQLDFTYFDTLAAALANASQFPQAQQALQKAIAAAPQQEAKLLKKRLALYASQRPFREAPVATAQAASLKVQKR